MRLSKGSGAPLTVQPAKGLGTRLQGRRSDESGAVAVLVAALSLVMFGIAALVVDLGLARDTRREAQNAADSAALAAANALYLSGVANPTAAAAAAKEYAAQNFGTTDADWGQCSDPARPAGFVPVPGQTACISFSGTPTVDEVRVVVPTRQVKTPLGRLLGVDEVEIGAVAQAAIDPGGKARCGLCVIGPGTHDLENGDIQVSDADVHFNGDSYPKPEGHITVTRGVTTVEGQAMTGNYSPAAMTGVPPISDPLAGASLPTAAGLTPRSNPCSGGPGIYGARKFSNSTCTLAPGLYVIAGNSGAKWLFEGNSSTRLEGTGVTLFFTCGAAAMPRACNAGEAGAQLDTGGNGTLNIKAPTTGPWAGMAIIYDRNNASQLRLRGNGLGSTSGTIYQAAGTLFIAGNGCGSTVDSLIVVNDLDMDGNDSCLTMTYTKEKNVLLPGGPLHLSE